MALSSEPLLISTCVHIRASVVSSLFTYLRHDTRRRGHTERTSPVAGGL
jgi:hypothetical protein